MLSTHSRLIVVMGIEEFNIKVIIFEDKVFRFAKRILDSAEEAQDVTQDIFEKLWNMRSRLKDYNNLEAFAIKSTKNLCYDRLKHENVKLQKADELKVIIPSETQTTDEDTGEVKQIINKVISQLPEKQKAVIHLRDIEGYEFSEMEVMLDMDINAIRVNLSRARKTVKQEVMKVLSYGL